MAKDKAAARLGRKGGTARAAALTPEERQEIARLGGLARKSKSQQNGTAPKSTAPAKSGITPRKHGPKKHA